MASESMNRTRTDAETDRRALLAGIGGLAAGTFLSAGRAEAGPLNPPGVPGPTPGPEPRIAVNEENTPGDGENMHVISQAGSYYLTGDVVGQSGRNGIKVIANDVVLDLMGYRVLGVPGCLVGVSVSAFHGFVLRNGIVGEWAVAGVECTNSIHGEALLEELIVRGNGLQGLSWLGWGCRVWNCVAGGNGGTGIYVSNRGAVVGCTARANTGDGIFCDGLVSDCLSVQNGGRGFSITLGSISNCTARQNQLEGIAASTSSVTNCTSAWNQSHGIWFNSACTVRGNRCEDNGRGGTGAGIYCEAVGSVIDGNQCTLNKTGIQVLYGGNFITRNVCSFNAAQWNVAAGNFCLVVKAIDSGAIVGLSGGVSPGSTDPNANYTY